MSMNITMRPWVRLVLTAVAGLVGAVLLCELGVRMLAPQQLIVLAQDVWRPDPVFGYRHHENANTTVNLGGGAVRFVTDGQGYRISTRPDTPKADRAILMLGDSFVEGLQVENEETIGGRLAHGLREMGADVRVDNAGVSGWTPNHYLLEARRSLSQRTYDLGIVCLYVGNDVIHRAVSAFPARQKVEAHELEIPPSLEWIEIVHAVIIPINDYLERRSHLFVLTRSRLRPHWPSRAGPTPLHPPVFDVSESNAESWIVTTRVCREIVRVFEARGIPVVFVLIPTQYQVEEGLWQRHLDRFDIDPTTVDPRQPNRLLQHHFGEAGLSLLDPLALFRKLASTARLYGSIDPHLNRAGYRALADYILPFVVAALPSPSTKRPIQEP